MSPDDSPIIGDQSANSEGSTVSTRQATRLGQPPAPPAPPTPTIENQSAPVTTQVAPLASPPSAGIAPDPSRSEAVPPGGGGAAQPDFQSAMKFIQARAPKLIQNPRMVAALANAAHDVERENIIMEYRAEVEAMGFKVPDLGSATADSEAGVIVSAENREADIKQRSITAARQLGKRRLY